jgi:hypothetical protein
MYTIRWEHNGRVHYLSCEPHDTAIMTFEALFDKGYRPELWQGATKLR